MLYRSTDRRCRRGAPMVNLAHSASFDSSDKNAPSKSGIKYLEPERFILNPIHQMPGLNNYFMNHVEPVAEPNPTSNIPWPLSIRWPIEYWNLLFYREGTYQPDPTKDDKWNHGAYLVQAGGHCGSCHTPRGMK